ncbi:hypothetical protein Micbo1qcDRAFT_207401 [Microdochium bolleyi]|uniref:BTB domain-containing protein n=1 Tax=Microdochium bolleyi TaxID=196109 RepID=A0A136ITI8_9PEZI|nr:hypothetical protein Micbo1qcDRAFT_207401 [Microdochium bolleyi]
MDQADILGQISKLGNVNENLATEIQKLENRQHILEQRFDSDLACLNWAVCNRLPPLVSLLLLEEPPLALRSITQWKWQLSTLNTVRIMMRSLHNIEDNMQISREEAKNSKLDAADLLSKAALHHERCLSIEGEAASAQTRTRTQLEMTNRDIARVQEAIRDDDQLSVQMTQKAREHDNKVNDSKIVGIAPTTTNTNEKALVVNVLDSYRECYHHSHFAINGKADAQTQSIRKSELETTVCNLAAALDQLKTARTAASDAANHAAEQRDGARTLTVRYDLLSAKAREFGAAPEAETETVVLDPRGDLFVLASGRGGSWGSPNPVRFQVCSRALARSSRVFERMLYGGVAESQPADAGDTADPTEWLVRLPEDPAPAARQLFEIMHSRFRSSEGDQNPVHQLYDLVSLADFYGSVALLRPLVHMWVYWIRMKKEEELSAVDVLRKPGSTTR